MNTTSPPSVYLPMKRRTAKKRMTRVTRMVRVYLRRGGDPVCWASSSDAAVMYLACRTNDRAFQAAIVAMENLYRSTVLKANGEA